VNQNDTEDFLTTIQNEVEFYNYFIESMKRAKERNKSEYALRQEWRYAIQTHVPTLSMPRNLEDKVKLFHQTVSDYSEEAFGVYICAQNVAEYITEGYKWKHPTKKSKLMTPFKEKGYDSNDKFTHPDYPNAIFILDADDDTQNPQFNLEDGSDYHFLDIDEITRIVNIKTKTQPTNSTGELPMNPSNIIETQINVFNQNAADMSDDQLFSKMREVEIAINNLKKTEIKSSKLAAKINEMETQLKALVTYVDERD